MSGTHVGKQIQKYLLVGTDLEMDAFLSENAIRAGEHIPEEILKFLVQTDVLFVNLEPGVTRSDWVE